MPPLGPRDARLGERLRQARRSGEGVLMVYLTLADPLTSGPPDLAEVLARSGADILELGLPTPSTCPRGAEIAASFRRARDNGQVDPWGQIARLRKALPTTPLVLLCYPETIGDIGWPDLPRLAAEAEVDALVLTNPSPPRLREVAAFGIHSIPLISPTRSADTTQQLEKHATCLTYRPLAAGTGEPLDVNSAARTAANLAATATKPFVVGFGIRKPAEIAILAPHVTGVVIGSELLRLIAATPPAVRPERAAAATRAWKAALRRSNTAAGRRAVAAE